MSGDDMHHICPSPSDMERYGQLWLMLAQAMDECRVTVILEDHPAHAAGLQVTEIDELQEFLCQDPSERCKSESLTLTSNAAAPLQMPPMPRKRAKRRKPNG